MKRTSSSSLRNQDQDMNNCPTSPTSSTTQERILRRTQPEVRTRDGRPLNPDDESFLLQVVREHDRMLLRLVTDHLPNLPLQIVNFQDANGVTPLIYLASRGDYALVKMLSDVRGIDVNLADNEGNTPLIVASQGGHSSVVSFLLDRFRHEIDLNRRNVFGFTAVMKAALQGRVKCLRSLLASGANLHLKDPGKGFTAIEWAEFCGRKQCVDLLKSYHHHHHHNNRKLSSSGGGGGSTGGTGSGGLMSRQGKRLSQAWSDTESWLKSLRIGGGSGGSGSGSPTSPPTPTGRAAASASSISLVTGLSPANGNGGGGSPSPTDSSDDVDFGSGSPFRRQTKRRSLVIPSIYVTQDFQGLDPTHPQQQVIQFVS